MQEFISEYNTMIRNTKSEIAGAADFLNTSPTNVASGESYHGTPITSYNITNPIIAKNRAAHTLAISTRSDSKIVELALAVPSLSSQADNLSGILMTNILDKACMITGLENNDVIDLFQGFLDNARNGNWNYYSQGLVLEGYEDSNFDGFYIRLSAITEEKYNELTGN